MIGSACDRCGCQLERMDRQYLATIELRPMVGLADTDEDPGDRDHLLELHELIEAQADEDEVDEQHVQEFLLCYDCCCRLRDDPLTQDAAMHLGFSEN